MLAGSAGIAAVIGSIVLAFVQPEGGDESWFAPIAVLGAGLAGSKRSTRRTQGEHGW